MARIGVAGLGRMGSSLAVRLAGQGAEVTGWTRSGPSAAAAIGVPAANDLAGLIQSSDFIVLSLFDDKAVKEVIGALCTQDLTGRLILDTSTVSPALPPSLAPAVEAAGGALVDAPIAGGPEMVAGGTAGVFIGGSSQEAAHAMPIAELFAARVFHVGPLGAGLGMKLANNLMIAGLIATLSDALHVAKRSGLEFETTLKVIAGGPAGPPFLAARMERILGSDPSVGFPVSGAAKDVQVISQAAAELGVEVPVLARAREMIAVCMAEGLSDADSAAMIRDAWARA
ncbi:MAG: NAD(P)-dependent oxidoreductase [Pseudomonadota bacterium]